MMQSCILSFRAMLQLCKISRNLDKSWRKNGAVLKHGCLVIWSEKEKALGRKYWPDRAFDTGAMVFYPFTRLGSQLTRAGNSMIRIMAMAWQKINWIIPL